MFVVFEGPNGVGKSTLCSAFADELKQRSGMAVLRTREPTDTAFGRAIRLEQRDLPPRALAYAVIADRIAHVERTIEPAMADGTAVVCDRYVPSSLVLQVADGLSLDEVWGLNSELPVPTLCVYLVDSPTTLARRLAARGASDPGRRCSPSQELALYEQARLFLADRGWCQLAVDASDRSPQELAGDVAVAVGFGNGSR